VFGKDCPVPTYADLDELEALCLRYLGNEDERRELVAQCNALVSSGFSFAERATDLLRIVGLKPPKTAAPGAARHVDLGLFAA